MSRIGRGCVGHVAKWAVRALVADTLGPVVFDRSEAAHKVFVAVGGMKLDDPEVAAFTRNLFGQR